MWNNIVHFFETPVQQPKLAPGMQSPIPESQIVAPKPETGFQHLLDDAHSSISQLGQGAEGIVGQFANFFHRPQAPVDASQIPSQGPTQVPTATPTPLPGQDKFVHDMMQKNPAQGAQYYTNLYHQAVTGPGWSGHYYGETPTPTPTATPTPTPTWGPEQVPDKPLPTGLDASLKYVSQFVPQGMDPRQYYPALSDPGFMKQVMDADKKKPGLGNVLIMQAFHESTLGRANNGNNLFGALVGGEGGRNAQFPNDSAAVQYQLGPNVLGGGGNPNMNIMNEPGPLTARRLAKLYQSYNPEGAYIRQMLKALGY